MFTALQSSPPAGQPPAETIPAAAAASAWHRAEPWILVAEDACTEQRPIARLLQSQGHNVIAVDNGDDALWVLGLSNAPAIAVLDWSLPGLEGIDVCRSVRRKRSRAQTYILMIAGTEWQDIDCRTAGADDVLPRPLDRCDLLTHVHAAVERVTATNRTAGVPGDA